jgi:apolipoprotein N-acyltransferase
MKKFENPNWLLLIGLITMYGSHMLMGIDLLGWIAYTPFLVFLYRTKGVKSRLLFVLALLAGWSLVTSKIITPPLIYAFVFLYSVPIVLIHLPGFLIWDRYKDHRWSLFLFPGIMSLAEWVQYTYTPFASWGVIAYTQDDSLQIMQGLSLFGLPGLSFLLYWVNIGLASLYVGRKTSWSNTFSPALIITVLIIYGSVRISMGQYEEKDWIRVAAIGTESTIGGPNLPTLQEHQMNKSMLFKRTRKAREMGASIVVWNEGATYSLPEHEPSWIDSLKALAQDERVNLYASYIVAVSLDPFKYENKYLFINEEGELVYEYLKHEPVPGEPAVKGKEELKVFDIDGTLTGGAICYDYDFPYLAKGYGQLRADLMVVPSSDWRGIDPLHTKMAAFRAVEQGHSILRSTRFGLSAGITPYGELLSKLSSFDTNDKIMVVDLPKKGMVTLYRMIGDSFVVICLIAVLFILYKCRLEKQRKHKDVHTLVNA